MHLKIGELAERAGVTVRSLHHYDQIGLLRPSAHSDSGYRLYAHADVRRLYRILALRGIGISLADIGGLLDGQGTQLADIVGRQLEALDEEASRIAALRQRLCEVQDRIAAHGEPDLETWFATLRAMAVRDRYFSREEWQRLTSDSCTAPAWHELVADLRAQFAARTEPTQPAALALARRWIAKLREVFGSWEEGSRKLATMLLSEDEAQAQTGLEAGALAFLARAIACAAEPEERSAAGSHREAMSPDQFDAAYRTVAPWDIGRPQPAFVEWLGVDAPSGPVLEVGCGTGDLALHLAAAGCAVTAVDLSGLAIDLARAKARTQGTQVDFRVEDALAMSAPVPRYRTVVDCGFLHALSSQQQQRFARMLDEMVDAGGQYQVMGFAVDLPLPNAPRALSREHLESLFGERWVVERVAAARFVTRWSPEGVGALMATLRRVDVPSG